ncbi:Ig-like domain-containing protein, partial [Moraxella lacunata]|uniref:Ig-like domain-containing protein n=7 Tax=Moraxella TaxID=475 RepID=UPI0024816C48
TDANDKPIVSDAKGVFTIPAGKVPADNTIGAKDKAGNVGTDTVAPAKPATPDMTAQTDTGVSDTDNNTKNNKPSFTVKTPTDGEPVLMVDGKPVEAEVTKNNGTTTLTPKQPIPDGNHTVSVAVTDSAGNTSEPSEALSIVIDTQAPTKPEVTIGKNDDGKITDDEVDASGNVTITVGLPGDAKAGDTVVINNNDDEGTELTDEHIKAGKVEVKVKAPKDGTNLIANVLIKDKAGNQSETVSEIAERKITIPSKLAITTEQTEVTEGGTVTFKVTRTEGIDKESSVKWTLTGSTDNPVTVSGDNSDFADDQPTSGTLTFAPGETEKTIEVKIKDDKMVEKTEGFTVTLSDAKGATVTTDSTSSVIKNNDKLVVGLDKDSYSENPQVGSNSDQYTNNPKVIVSNIPNGAKWEYRLNNGKWKDGNNPNEGKATFDLKPAPDVWQGVSYKIEARVKPNQDYDSNSTLGSLDMTLDQSVRAPIITSVESGNQITGIAEANSFVYIDKDDSGSYSKGDVGTYADDKGKFTLPFGEKLAETGKDALIFGNQGKDVPLARLGVIDEAGNALGKEDMSHFFYFDSLDGRDYFSTATSKTGTTVASTTNLQDIPHTVYVNKVISAGTFNFGSADDVLVQNERYLQNNSYINMGGGDDYAKFNYIRQAGVGSVDMGSGNDILEVGLVGKSSFTGTTIKLGEGDDIVRGGAVDGLRSSLDGGKGHDLWEMTGEGITQNLSSIAGMEMIDLGGRKHKLNVKISDVINNADTATIINGQSYKGLFIKGTSQDTVDLGDNGKRSLGKFVQDNSKAPEGYNAYWDGSNENTLIFIQQGINVI